MTIPVATFRSSGQIQNSSSSIDSTAGGTLTVGAGKLACILFASSRSDTTTNVCKVNSVTASGLTFTQVFDEGIEFNVGGSFPLTNWHVQMFTAPVAAGVSALAWSSAMSNAFVNEQIAIVFDVASLTDLAHPFDGLLAPASAVHYASNRITTGSVVQASVNLTTTSTSDLFLSVFLDSQLDSEGATPRTPAPGAGQTQLATVASTRQYSVGNLFVQDKGSAAAVTAQAQTTGFNSELQLNIALAFTGAVPPVTRSYGTIIT